MTRRYLLVAGIFIAGFCLGFGNRNSRQTVTVEKMLRQPITIREYDQNENLVSEVVLLPHAIRINQNTDHFTDPQSGHAYSVRIGEGVRVYCVRATN